MNLCRSGFSLPQEIATDEASCRLLFVLPTIAVSI